MKSPDGSLSEAYRVVACAPWDLNPHCIGFEPIFSAVGIHALKLGLVSALPKSVLSEIGFNYCTGPII